MSKAEASLAENSERTPAVSVVMPVHNAMPYLDQAVQSILGQSFEDFEFVILDDGSTDGSTERLRHWAALDDRIRLIEVHQNLGPVGSSNMVAQAAKAPLVARMDADDISEPDRLAEQVALLRTNSDVGLVASVGEMIDAQGRKIRDPERWRLARPSVFVPFAHGVIMYRRHVFERLGGYRPECEFWEDYDLVMRMAGVTKIVVLTKSLFRIRRCPTSTRVACDQERLERALDLAYRTIDLLKAGKSYEGLLREPLPPGRKIDPRVFRAMGSHQLWVGGKPRLLRRTLRRARLSPDLRTASAVIWAAWASASPGSLRAFLKLLLGIRNRLARSLYPRTSQVLWNPLDAHGVGDAAVVSAEARNIALPQGT